MQMSGSGWNKDENEPQHVRKWTDRILTLSFSKAESILNLYKKSTQYKFFKIYDGALSENRQRDRERSL